ncbi:MAG: DUF3035 domain-containing protein [Candidatus Paracaedimonas acanthamoebae]|uniref:DUF3035 domain-containing protein n=1 Tax=Candidatus Paracaedimonas acanthamoebae TaxID=244581 RepID=A0A8J7PPM7_9PROT|nr:DUF3035 domain-containing protein [Candidatus Paracaedimonas acanthamoebae]
MNKKYDFLFLALLSTSLLVISGCSQTKKSLGLERMQPDEFTVLDHPPLSMPPGIGLTPPQTGASAKHPQNTHLQAKELLIKQSLTTEISSVSPAEQALLNSAKIEESHPNIRQTVNQEAKVSKPGEQTIKKIIFWEGKPSGDVIDPQEEYKKLHNKDAPGPLN